METKDQLLEELEMLKLKVEIAKLKKELNELNDVKVEEKEKLKLNPMSEIFNLEDEKDRKAFEDFTKAMNFSTDAIRKDNQKVSQYEE